MAPEGERKVMFGPEALKPHLPIGRLGEPFHFFDRIGSTNDYAQELARQLAPHGTLVVADEQTAGRGRWQRNWSTPPGAALAFSLVLRPDGIPSAWLTGLNALGALAVALALEAWDLGARIKWPNDVLLSGRKVAGVLVEADWVGERLAAVVLGIGVNVKGGSAPSDDEVDFPATSVEEVLGEGVERRAVLLKILEEVDRWWDQLGSEALRSAWESRLAYRNEAVAVEGRQGRLRGKLIGISGSGYLRIETPDGTMREVGDDFSRLRPVDKAGS